MNDEAERLKVRWAESDQAELDEVLSTLMSVAKGRRFINHILSLGKIGQNPFTSNALTMSFNCGELNVGQKILSEILALVPDRYILLQQEANDEWRARNTQLNNLTPGGED